MLGLLLIFFIGKYFYELAQDYYKQRWLYAILGVVVYYAAGAVFGIILGVADVFLGLGIDWENSFGWNLVGIPIGIAADYGFYILLKRKWEREVVVPKDEIMDIGKPTDDLDPPS
ncbi:MAG: hypothetical protein KJO41_10395 [Bacteroidia bacterium]|nr:hypothetical protein [Bacteroidia bacterium]NND25064.1 hypothetical protein [Flavobacteriaceae bacterium]MBT8279402.1 hypothetical protein [Bacteroidia bacterium]NNK59382.1 hypothetical protein [Flavobacteriaceae bacterium]NNL33810.1 hypothetical protein [Flavobacteriaceae bacterium]